MKKSILAALVAVVVTAFAVSPAFAQSGTPGTGPGPGTMPALTPSTVPANTPVPSLAPTTRPEIQFLAATPDGVVIYLEGVADVAAFVANIGSETLRSDAEGEPAFRVPLPAHMGEKQIVETGNSMAEGRYRKNTASRFVAAWDKDEGKTFVEIWRKPETTPVIARIYLGDNNELYIRLAPPTADDRNGNREWRNDPRLAALGAKIDTNAATTAQLVEAQGNLREAIAEASKNQEAAARKLAEVEQALADRDAARGSVPTTSPPGGSGN